MDALLDRFAENQFFELSTEGEFAAIADGRALQISAPDKSVHFYVGKQSPKEHWQSFTTCRIAFIDVYNGIYAPQTVDNNQGESIFGTRRSR
jgi:hypothetical protein